MDDEAIIITLAFLIPFIAGLIRPIIFREIMRYIKHALIWVLKFLWWFIRQIFLALGDFFISFWERLRQGPDF